MAIRTSDALIAGVITLNDNFPTTQAIAAANLLVDQLCADSGYTDAHLTTIETWLAAHYYACFNRAPRASMESAGRGMAQVSYFGRVGLYLTETRWGQMAITLDTEGNLSAWQAAMEKGKPRKASLTWIGNESEYSDAE
jgi:hypothetical protein